MLAHDIPLRVVKLLNVILMTIPFAWCWYGYYVGQMENSFYFPDAPLKGSYSHLRLKKSGFLLFMHVIS